MVCRRQTKNKQLITKSININLCKECHNVKVISKEGLPTCSQCGLVDTLFIDEKPEWTSGITDDGRVNDPARCGNPNSNPELFQNHGVKVQLFLHRELQRME